MTDKEIITGNTEDKICLRCESENIVKNGFRDLHLNNRVFKLQKYKCQKCSYVFDEFNGREGKKWKKEFSLLAYQEGLSFNKISKIIGVSYQTVSRWIKPNITDEIISLHAINNLKMTPEKEENLRFCFEQNQ